MLAAVRGVHAFLWLNEWCLRASLNQDNHISDSKARLFRMHRLDASEYKVVFNSGRPLHGRTLSIWVRCTTDAGRRAGVVVSKKNFHRAVDRNRAKRLMREAYRLNRCRIAEDVDLIMSARRGMAGKGLSDVSMDLEQLCRRAGVWQQNSGC